MTGQELCAKLIAIIDGKDATIATAEKIISGQQRLIELQERKLAAVERVATQCPIESMRAIRNAMLCTCPVLDGVQVTGSSCPVHGFPSTTL